MVVIHGGDEPSSHQLFEFLEKLELWPRSLRSEGDAGAVSPERIAGHLDEAAAAIVLLTPDEEARLAAHLSFGTADLERRRIRRQGRADVYLAAGIAAGRVPQRTVVVDLIGAGAPLPGLPRTIDAQRRPEWRRLLAEELRRAGCSLPDRLASEWRKEGELICHREVAGGRLGFTEFDSAWDALALQIRSWRLPQCVVSLDGEGDVLATMLARHLGASRRAKLEPSVTGREFRWEGEEVPAEIAAGRATLLVAGIVERTVPLLRARRFLASHSRNANVAVAALAMSCAPVVDEDQRGRPPVPDFLGIPGQVPAGTAPPWR